MQTEEHIAAEQETGAGPDSGRFQDAMAWLAGGAPQFSTGRVIGVGDQDVQVLTESLRQVRAKRAAACLLDPEAGDVVLVFQSSQETYILSVLEKNRQASTLSFTGDVSVKSLGKAAFASREMDVSAVGGRLRFVDASLVSKSLRVRLGKAVCLAKTLETTAESVIGRVKRSFRQVFETETLRAGAVRQFIEGRFYQRSQNTTILADEKVQVDGEKIELG
ncbi:MAG: DUF3540 domain-containing protein [Desulfovibrionaceae bacterium]